MLKSREEGTKKLYFILFLISLRAEKPAILQDPNDVEVLFGSNAVFKCTAEGDPTPEIKWMLNSNEINLDDTRFHMLTDGTLEIDGIQERDQGVCIDEKINKLTRNFYFLLYILNPFALL
jgi:Immunoglobulin I-set domain